MRHRMLLVGRGALLAATMLMAAATAVAQVDPPQVDPTHYWSYRLEPPYFQPAALRVSDQFFREPVPIQVDALERLLNWVYKNNSQVRDTFLHYTWWNVPTKIPMPRTVDVLNQFGLQTVHVENVEFLLAPALKNDPQPTLPTANHYLCYRAVGGHGTGTTYLLRDEWRVDQQAPDLLEYLCLPCWKEHAGQVFDPPDTLTHLAVYRIHPTSPTFYPFIMDQFADGPRLVHQLPPEYLFVPSLKYEQPTPALRGSWGRLKSLSR